MLPQRKQVTVGTVKLGVSGSASGDCLVIPRLLSAARNLTCGAQAANSGDEAMALDRHATSLMRAFAAVRVGLILGIERSAI